MATYDGPVHGPGADSPRAEPRRARVTQVARTGISFGSALAIAISWSVNQSILWAIVHGFLSWIYVVWYAVTR